jgi:photosystem II protein
MAAQSMLMSGVSGVASGRSLLQAARPAATPFSRLALSAQPSYYKHMPSLSVRTMALFGKSKTKAAPAKKVRTNAALFFFASSLDAVVSD